MWPHRFPGASGPGRPRDRHTRAYGSEWSISKPARALRTLRRPPAPSTPVGSRRPLIGRYLVCSADVPGASGPGRPLAVGAACCCLWHRWCSGRLRARPPARSPHASLRLGVVDLEARPCPPDPPAPSGALHTGGVAAASNRAVLGVHVLGPALPPPTGTAARTTHNPPTTNGPKNPDPSSGYGRCVMVSQQCRMQFPHHCFKL